jgi:hypothetical protein
MPRRQICDLKFPALIVNAVVLDHRCDHTKPSVGRIDPHSIDAIKKKLQPFAKGQRPHHIVLQRLQGRGGSQSVIDHLEPLPGLRVASVRKSNERIVGLSCDHTKKGGT